MTIPSECTQQEDGYVLIGVVFFVALVLLSLAIAAPKVAASIQRDRELELINRGEQYKRAIKLYYKKFGSYPGNMEQLEKSNNIRFLRKRYVDPLTGKDDWKLIHIGEAHLHPLGFFGKPLSATGAIGGATGLNGGTSTTLGQGSQTGQALGTTSLGGTTSAPGGSGGGGLYAGVDNSGTSGSGPGDGSGSGTSSATGSGTSSGSSTGFGANTSQTLGGAPIVGVVIASTKTTIVEYKLQKTYKDWEFVYDPVEEQAVAAGSLLGGGANINGSSGTSGGIGSSGINSGNPTGAGGFGVNGGSISGAPSSGSGAGSGSSSSPGSGTGGGITPQ